MLIIKPLDDIHGPESENTIQDLYRLYNCVKVNLPEDESKWVSGNGEGVWAAPCSEEDSQKCRDDNSYHEDAFVRLMNQPLFHPLIWGDKIRVQTRGDKRPVAYLEEMSEEDMKGYINRLLAEDEKE